MFIEPMEKLESLLDDLTLIINNHHVEEAKQKMNEIYEVLSLMRAGQ